MEGDYRFLTEHSYSMVDYDTLSLKQRAIKTKKSRATQNRSNKTQSANRTVSIDRSSSDKENNLSTSASVPIPARNKAKSPAKKKTSASRLAANARKKQDTKTLSKHGIKPTQSTIMKNKNKKKKSNISDPIEKSDALPSLSIEERVKLRRTTPFVTPIVPVLNTKPESKVKSSIEKPRKQIRASKQKKNVIQSKKFFLGSGLDLDNIVLGNRHRRSIKA